VAIVLLAGCWIFSYDIIGWSYVSAVVPGGRALRAVSRGLLLLLIPAALGVACFFERPRRMRKSMLAACGLGLACLLEQGVTTASFDKYVQRAEVALLARRVDGACTCFYYSPSRHVRAINQYHLDAMWASLDSGIPTVNGYSGWSPRGWRPLDEAVASGDRDVARLERALADWAALHQLDPQAICWIRDVRDAQAPPPPD
jgi:hypothetical protein